jgi:hypothetical protein
MKWVVLHEMAHEVRHYRRDRFTPEAAHGWQYAATYLDLVMWFMGSEAHDKLKAAFKKHKVKFSKPRTGRLLSAEEKQVLRDRLAKARSDKLAQQAGDQWPELAAALEKDGGTV